MIKVVPNIRPCDCENLADFSRYYRFSWMGWHGHPDGPMPAAVQNVDDRYVYLSDIEGNSRELPWERAMKELSFATPDYGMVNADHTIIYIHGIAPRQPHRGYRPNDVRQTIFNGWALRNIKAPQTSDRTVIRNLFYPVYYDLQEALAKLNSGERIGCALSRHIGLYTSSEEKFPSIAYRRQTVGYLRDDKTACIPRVYSDAIVPIRKKLGVEVVTL